MGGVERVFQKNLTACELSFFFGLVIPFLQLPIKAFGNCLRRCWQVFKRSLLKKMHYPNCNKSTNLRINDCYLSLFIRNLPKQTFLSKGRVKRKTDYIVTSIKRLGRYLAEITISWSLRNSDMSLGMLVSEEDITISKQTFKVVLKEGLGAKIL